MDIGKFRTRLLVLREEIVRLHDVSNDSRAVVELDQQSVGRLSRMDAIQQQAMALATEQQRQLQMKRIDSALARIDSGTYGECVRCGEAIPEKRLMADLTITLCIDCARG
ncbi:TraR/DksA family transcriptional regulator [Oceanibaculum nanhaiense]|uniref:TraR/DksA family transcriptional regulator n=1 Tax=Oceanibaculum nanhaiense TaxID=1909734 RepID=UPI00396EFBA5